jgi:hypothetical protein
MDTQQFWPISNGLVPGWTQTALRGEIWAAISAMRFAISHQRQVRIWCDNHTVVTRLQKFGKRHVRIKPNATNADLWTVAQQLVQTLGPALQVTKISSHQDPLTAKDEAEEWLFAGNEAADCLTQTVFSRHKQLYELWDQLQKDLEAIHVLRNKMHDVIISVAQVAVQSKTSRGEQRDKQHPSRINVNEVNEVKFCPLADNSFADSYQCEEGQRIAGWLQTVCDPSEPVQAISWFQLNILYEFQNNTAGVRYNKSRKKWENASASTKSADFVARTKSFSKWIQGALQSQAHAIQPLHLRPSSEPLQFWTMCVPIRIRKHMRDTSDEIFRSSAPRLTTVRSLRRL